MKPPVQRRRPAKRRFAPNPVVPKLCLGMRPREALLRPSGFPVVPKRRLGMRPAKRRFAPLTLLAKLCLAALLTLTLPACLRPRPPTPPPRLNQNHHSGPSRLRLL